MNIHKRASVSYPGLVLGIALLVASFFIATDLSAIEPTTDYFGLNLMTSLAVGTVGVGCILIVGSIWTERAPAVLTWGSVLIALTGVIMMIAAVFAKTFS